MTPASARTNATFGARRKIALDFDATSNRHGALLEQPRARHDHYAPYIPGYDTARRTDYVPAPLFFCPSFRPHRHDQGQARVDLFVKDTGGSGRAIILTHAWPLNADIWDYQAVALSKAGLRVISYDRRGFGRSENRKVAIRSIRSPMILLL